jgi:hypothetical protein
MRRTDLHKRAVVQEPPAPAPCPRCQAITDMSNKELERRLAGDLEFFEGRCDYLGSLTDLPEHSPTCPLYQKATSKSETEIDAKLARLADVLRKRGVRVGSKTPK